MQNMKNNSLNDSDSFKGSLDNSLDSDIKSVLDFFSKDPHELLTSPYLQKLQISKNKSELLHKIGKYLFFPRLLLTH
jgi:hypothetical protein